MATDRDDNPLVATTENIERAPPAPKPSREQLMKILTCSGIAWLLTFLIAFYVSDFRTMLALMLYMMIGGCFSFIGLHNLKSAVKESKVEVVRWTGWYKKFKPKFLKFIGRENEQQQRTKGQNVRSGKADGSNSS